jgi:hypothetical protein
LEQLRGHGMIASLTRGTTQSVETSPLGSHIGA